MLTLQVNVIVLLILEYPTLMLVFRSEEDLLGDWVANGVQEQRLAQAAVIVYFHSDLSYL